MATFNQRSDALREYVSPIDVNTYGKVLIGLQAGYDKNVGELTKAEEELKKIAQNTNLHPEAKDYFYKRMRERKDVLEKNIGNFAFANELDYGMKVLNSAVDDNVAIEMYNGSIFNKIGADYKKLAEGKNPELANSVNLEYSLQDINKWQNTKGHLGQKFQGNSTYIPYTDIQKVLQDVQKILPPNTYAEINQFGAFTYMSGGKEVQLGANIERAVDAVISSNAGVSKQIEINAWNQFRGEDDKSMANYFAEYASSKAQQYSQLSNSHKAFEEGEKLGKKVIFKKDATMSDEEATAMEKSSNYYKNQSDGYLSMIKGIKNGTLTRKDIEREIYKGELKHNFGNTFAYTKMKEKKFITDNGAMNIWNEQNKQSQFNATMAYNMQKDEADRVLEMTKAYNKGELTAENMLQQGVDPNVVSSIASADLKHEQAPIEPLTIDAEKENVANAQTSNTKRLNELYQELTVNYGVGVDLTKLSNADRDEFFKGLEKSLTDGKDGVFEFKSENKVYKIKENQKMLDHIAEVNSLRANNTSLNQYSRTIYSLDADGIDRTKYRYVAKSSPLMYKEGYTPELELQEIATGKIVSSPISNVTTKNILNFRNQYGVTFGTTNTITEINSPMLKAEAIRMGYGKDIDGMPAGVENMTSSEIIKLMNNPEKDRSIPDFKLKYNPADGKIVIQNDKGEMQGQIDQATINSSNILSKTTNEFKLNVALKSQYEKKGATIYSQTMQSGLVQTVNDNGEYKKEVIDPNKYVSLRTIDLGGKIAIIGSKQDVFGNIYVSRIINNEWNPNAEKFTEAELQTSEGKERLANVVELIDSELRKVAQNQNR